MFVLEKKLGIADVDGLTQSLSLLLEEDNNGLVVDANAVETLDIAALQVLVAFSGAAVKLSKPVHWLAESGMLREFSGLAGLDSFLSFDAPVEASTEAEGSEQMLQGEKSEGVEEPEDDGLCPVF